MVGVEDLAALQEWWDEAYAEDAAAYRAQRDAELENLRLEIERDLALHGYPADTDTDPF